MRKYIKNFLVVLVVILSMSGQVVLADSDDLNTDIYNHLKNWDTDFNIDYYNSDVLDLVRDIAKKDDYLSISLSRLVCEKAGSGGILTVTYKTTKEQEEYINKELTMAVKSIITNNMSDYEKVKAVNKYLVNRLEYDKSLESNNAYKALTTGKATCQGYAMAAYKMLNLIGIENRIVIGKIGEVPHGWNSVKINNKWYNLDITNNDAVGSDKYFLRKDSVLKGDGFTWDSSKYPQCNDDYSINVLVDLKNLSAYTKGWNLINTGWYFLGDDGNLKTGWIYTNGKWYYCYPENGKLAMNTIINGYTVDSSGAWIE